MFDGVAAARVAMERCDLSVSEYYASEVDPVAIGIVKSNFPDVVQMGDVSRWREWEIDWSKIDFVLGGSPCQGFSYAGKGLAFEDPRSKLFFEFADILDHVKEANPDVFFMLENVKMKAAHCEVITDFLGVRPVAINSAAIGYCSRPRLYWTNWWIQDLKDEPRPVSEIVDFEAVNPVMSPGWHKWWKKNSEFQLRKVYSKLLQPDDQGVALTTRQYASWNGNFVETPLGDIRKLNREELALCQNFPRHYFNSATQRQTEIATGNSWTIDVICHLLRSAMYETVYDRETEALL